MSDPVATPARSKSKDRIISGLVGILLSALAGAAFYVKTEIPEVLRPLTTHLKALVDKTEEPPASATIRFQSYFVIQSATMLLSLEEDATKPEQLNVKERIVYTLLFLKDFDDSHGRFSEQFELLDANKSSHWPGSENEILSDAETGRTFDVRIAAKKGETRTFVTGVNFIVDPLSLAAQRPEMHGKLFAVRSQRLTDYDNKYGDIIGELNIIVSSQSLVLKPIGSGGKILRVDSGEDLQDTSVHVAGPEDGASGYTSIAARFETIMPGDDAGIFYEWHRKGSP